MSHVCGHYIQNIQKRKLFRNSVYIINWIVERERAGERELKKKMECFVMELNSFSLFSLSLSHYSVSLSLSYILYDF